MVKIGIVGSRTFQNYKRFLQELNKVLIENNLVPSVIISGGAIGTDSLAKDYANDNNIKLIEYLPEYNKYPKKVAPLMRNTTIIQESDVVIAFWENESKGTGDVIKKCESIKKRCIKIEL